MATSRLLTAARGLLVGGALALGGCFSPSQPICSYACADNAPRCPDHYECRPDGYCHRIGTTAACSFSDMSTDMSANVPDMGMDASVPLPHDAAPTD